MSLWGQALQGWVGRQGPPRWAQSLSLAAGSELGSKSCARWLWACVMLGPRLDLNKPTVAPAFPGRGAKPPGRVGERSYPQDSLWARVSGCLLQNKGVACWGGSAHSSPVDLGWETQLLPPAHPSSHSVRPSPPREAQDPTAACVLAGEVGSAPWSWGQCPGWQPFYAGTAGQPAPSDASF